MTPLRLRREDGASPLVVAHRGAAALAQENSLAAVEAALRLGVDLVEVDVLAGPGGGLVLAHTTVLHDSPSLDAALELIAASRAGVVLDLKAPGLERDAAGALRRFGLIARTVVCSVSPAVLRRVRAEEPRVARALSYPDDRFGLAERPWLAPAVRGGLATLRRTLPWRAPRWVRSLGVEALSVSWQLVTPELVARTHAAGAALLVWTVPDRDTANRLRATGIDAMIADDPRFLMESTTP